MKVRYSNLTAEQRKQILNKLNNTNGMPKKCPWCNSSNLNSMEYDPNSCSEFVCLDCGLHCCVTCQNIYG